MRETLKRIFRFAIPVVGPAPGRRTAVVRAVGLLAAALALCLAVPAGAQANDTSAGVVTARSEGTTSLIVTMPYTGDANGNNTVTVEYKLCTDTVYTSTSATHSASPYIVTISSLTANTCYDIKATYNEVGPDVVTGTNPQLLRISTTWDTTMLHNRNRFPGSTKWDANGGWGMPGTKYGQFTCETCHTSPTANIKRIKETIAAPNAPTDTFPGSTVLFQSVSTPNGFGDDNPPTGHTTSQKICEVCHSQNSVHNYNTTGQSDLGHNNNVDCTQCHPHNLGFVGGGACNTCHGAPPGISPDTNAPAGDAASHAKHYDYDAGGLITSYGTTATRSTTSAYVFDCGRCHGSNGADHGSSGDANTGVVDVKLPTGETFTRGGTAIQNTPPPGGITFYFYNNSTCSSVYCHGNFTGGTTSNSPKWGDSTTGACGTCHGASTEPTPTGGSHGSHVGTVSGIMLDCSKCHNGIASIGTVSDKKKHVNIAADWKLDSSDPRIGSGTYSNTQEGFKSPPSSTYGSCANMYCHSIVQTASSGGALTGLPGEYKTPTWGNQATGECGTCHAIVIASGSHTPHISTYLCGTCHLDRGDNTTFHANRTINLNFNQAFSYGATPGYSPEGLNHSPGGGYSSCSNLYCHSIVQTASGGALTGAVGEYKAPTWGTASSGQCGTCHAGNGVDGDTGSKMASGSHTKHLDQYGSACTRCHNVTDSHATGSINLAFNLPYDYGATEDYTQGLTHNPGNGYGTCSNIYCHSIVQTTTGGDLTGAVGQYKTVAWSTDNGTIGCASCHGNPSASGGHLKHAGTGAGQYGFTCAQCHSGQVPPATTHADGSIQATIASTWGGSYNAAANIIPGKNDYSTCSNTYCHSKGTSVSTGTIIANTSANWGTAGPLDCTSCHGTESGTTGAPAYENIRKSPSAATGTNWTFTSGSLSAAVAASDNNYAIFNGSAQNYLFVTGFGFTAADIPAGSVINDITVIIEGNGASATASARQLEVGMTKNGTAVTGATKTGANTQLYQTSDREIVLGGNNDLWETTWTPADIQAPTFGVAIRDFNTTANALNIDRVRVVVHTGAAPKKNSHSNHASYTCSACHSNTVSAGNSPITGFANHVNKTYDVTGTNITAYTHNAAGGTCTNTCHGGLVGLGAAGVPQWGVSEIDCVVCHSITQSITAGPNIGGTRDAVSLEFNSTWSHKRSAGGAVTKADCVVCHLEGASATLTRSAKHGDGYIDLRDPDGATAEAAIRNIAGTADYRFGKFSTSYAAGSRTTNGHLTESTDNIITQKFCLKCHDTNGATNAGARVAGGTQYKPFNTTISGAAYVTPLSAGVTGGVVDVDTMFATTNSSVHPIKGPRFKGYPTPARYNAPYNNFTRTAGTRSNGVVMNCFDCHNVVGTPLTTRTVSAHGNAVTVRGVYVINGTPAAGTNEATLCKVCHAGYDTNTGASHGTGSANTNISRNEKVPFLRYGCNVCHSSGYDVLAVRPVRALDLHGVNYLPTTGQTLTGFWASTGRPYAFIRNRYYLADHSPQSIGGTTYTVQCNMAGNSEGNGVCNNRGNRAYTVGGVY